MKNKLWVLLTAATLLLSGCSAPAETYYALEDVTQTLDAALEDGHFFFAGKVLGAGTTERMISYYDMEADAHTVYQVEVTEDFFGCMPEEPLTVCVYGTKSSFNERINLEKGKEYLFDVTLWVQGEDPIYLLPSFYESMPERDGESLYFTQDEKTAVVKEGYSAYKEHLQERAAAMDYTAQRVWQKMTAHLQDVSARDTSYFEAAEFTDVDAELLKKTADKAEELMIKMVDKTPSWEKIAEVLKK